MIGFLSGFLTCYLSFTVLACACLARDVVRDGDELDWAQWLACALASFAWPQMFIDELRR